MKQAAVIMAAFVYNAATIDEKLPRKPAPAHRGTRCARTAARRLGGSVISPARRAQRPPRSVSRQSDVAFR